MINKKSLKNHEQKINQIYRLKILLQIFRTLLDASIHVAKGLIEQKCVYANVSYVRNYMEFFLFSLLIPQNLL